MLADPEIGSGGAPKTVVADELTASRRWLFVRKVYMIIWLQVLMTAGICVAAVLVHPFPRFFLSSSAGAWVIYMVILLMPFLVTWPLLKYKKKQWINLVLLSLFTVSISISGGVACSTIAGRGVLQSAVLLPVALTILITYTFWAASGGSDFKFLIPFAFTSLSVAVAYLFEQAVAPIGPVETTAYGAGATVIFTAFLIFETKRIVKTHTCDQFVIGAITLYVDMMSLFMAQPTFK